MHELPVFSKKAARRVKDPLPIPTYCPHCAGAVTLENNAAVYGRSFGEWPWVYLCQTQGCRAYVGTHPETNIPLGTLATAVIREARKKAKDKFNALWPGGQMTRTEAYSWLATRLNIPTAACHFGWFNEAQCNQALAVLTDAARPPERTVHATKALSDIRALLAGAQAAR